MKRIVTKTIYIHHLTESVRTIITKKENLVFKKNYRCISTLSTIVEGALLICNVWDHRVRPTVHQDFRDFAVHVLEQL